MTDKCQQEQELLRERIKDQNIQIESLELQLGVYDSSNDDSDSLYTESETEIHTVTRRVETRAMQNRMDAKKAITKTEWRQRMQIRFNMKTRNK